MATTSLVRSVPRVLATARRVRIQLVVIRAQKDCGDNYCAKGCEDGVCNKSDGHCTCKPGFSTNTCKYLCSANCLDHKCELDGSCK